MKDPRALASKVRDVLSLPHDEWQHRSDAAYRTATGFSWDDATALFEQALRRAIERTQRGELASTGPGRGGIVGARLTPSGIAS